MKSFDIIIVGGGIVGCMTARYLSRYDLKILLIEKESDIGMGPSAANSACIHAGHDPVHPSRDVPGYRIKRALVRDEARRIDELQVAEIL